MGGKHKKFIRSEKAKVKLKGAKLVKGLNITKTEFKVKKIILREQLQDEILESGRKKHNIKEIVSRLKHHNSSFRTEALKNLREYFIHNKEDTLQNVGVIIHAIAAMSLDIEKDIRRQSFKVLSDLLKMCKSTALEPFFGLISSHLKCAMSHLNQSIQEDSLLFLDVFLIYLPYLITQNYSQIFSNFLNMISKLRTDSKPGRMLTINLGNKTTTIKWRSKILDRLQRMLQIIVKDWKQKTNILEQDNGLKIVYLKEHSPYITLYNKTNYEVPNIFKKSIGQYDDEIDNGKIVEKYISCLFPLLIESWMEVRPNFANESITSQLLLSNEAATTLNIILDILECLWEMVEIWESTLNSDFTLSLWFGKNFASEFVSQLFNKFPYQQYDGEKKIGNKKKEYFKNAQVPEGLTCIEQNMSLIYLYNIFNRKEIVKNKAFSKSILNYFQSILENFQIPVNHFEKFEKALRSILLTNGKYFIKVDIKCKDLLRTVIVQYRNDNYPKTLIPYIVALLCDIVLSKDDLLHIYGPNELSSWLPVLPTMLIKPVVSERVLKTLTNLGKQKNALFLKSLGEEIENIIENIETVKVVECTNIFEGKKLIMNLFYWIDFWTKDYRNYLIEKIDKTILDKDISKYFKFIIEKTYI